MPLKATLIAKMYESHVQRQCIHCLSFGWFIYKRYDDVNAILMPYLKKKNICIVVKGGESCRNEFNQVEKALQNPV